jgi:hypothetical protein
MEPTPAAGQDVQFKNGTPIVSSPGQRFDVVVSPKTGPTGRYELTDRVGLMVGVYNHTDRRIEVSESDIIATANQTPARVLRATEIEDSIISDSKWALFQNAVGGAFQQIAAQRAGVSTYSGTSSFSGTASRFGEISPVRVEGNSSTQGTSFNEGAAMAAQRQAALDTAANASAIRAQTRTDLARVATVFQRNTIEPNDSYLGAVIIEPPRKTACKVVVVKGVDSQPPVISTVTTHLGYYGSGDLTVTGPPFDSPHVIVTIIASGGRGAGTFRYSLDDGKTFSNVFIIPSSGNYIVPNTGLTLAFSAGTFGATDQYLFRSHDVTSRAGPCRLKFTVNIAGEAHAFEFTESENEG